MTTKKKEEKDSKYWKEVDPSTLTPEEKAQCFPICEDEPHATDPHREQGPHYEVGDVVDTLKYMLKTGAISQEQYDKAISAMVEGLIMQDENK